jgi:hypothetical protein
MTWGLFQYEIKGDCKANDDNRNNNQDHVVNYSNERTAARPPTFESLTQTPRACYPQQKAASHFLLAVWYDMGTCLEKLASN